MADVAERAQMLLIGGLAFAIVLVALALVVNTVIYTENVATREEDISVEPVSSHRTVEESVGGLITRVNEEQVGAPYETLYSSYYVDSFPAVRDGIRANTLSNGAVMNVTELRGYEGSRIVQNESGKFLPDSDLIGETDEWVLVRDANVRAYRMTVTDDSGFLKNIAEADVKGVLAGALSDNVFYVEFVDEDGDLRRVAVYENNGTGDTAVTVYDGSTNATCTIGASTVDIDISKGVLEGGGERVSCEALDFHEELDGHTDVRYNDGGLVEGTYDMTVDRTPGVVRAVANTANGVQCNTYSTYTGTPSRSPFVASAIYATDIEVEYTGPSASYDTVIRAAPDERSKQATAPLIEHLAVEDHSENSSSYRAIFNVTWEVSDPNNDLQNVSLIVRNTDRGNTYRTIDAGSSGTFNVTGVNNSADNDNYPLGLVDDGDNFTFTLIAQDLTTERRTRTKQHADLDSDDCASDVNEPPTAAYDYSPTDPEVGESVTFDASSSDDADGSISSYKWDLNGDGSTNATGEIVTTTYSTAGDKTVILNVTDDDGATETRSRTVSVSGASDPPNVQTFSIADNSVEDASGNDDTAEFEVDWKVSDPDSDLSNLRLTLVHKPSSSAKTVDTQTIDLSSGGSPQNGTTTLKWTSKNVYNDDFKIIIKVEDQAGNADSDSKQDTADGVDP